MLAAAESGDDLVSVRVNRSNDHTTTPIDRAKLNRRIYDALEPAR